MGVGFQAAIKKGWKFRAGCAEFIPCLGRPWVITRHGTPGQGKQEEGS